VNRSACWRLPLAGVLIGLAPAAAAHPFGAQYAAHRVDLHVGPSEIQVGYIAEVPIPILMATGAQDPLGDMKLELLSGLVLQVNGTSVPLDVAGPAHVERNDDAYTIGLELVAHTESPIREVVLSDGNLPDVPGVFSSTATVAPAFQVQESSLLRIRDGEVARDDSGRWRMGPGHRETSLTLRRVPSLWTWVAPSDSTRPLPLADAVPPRWIDLVTKPIVTPATAAVSALLAVLAGLGAAVPRGGALLAPWAILPVLALLATPWTELAALALAMASLGAAVRQHQAAGALLIASIGLTTQSPLLALGVLGIYTVCCYRGTTHPQATSALALTVAATTAARISIG